MGRAPNIAGPIDARQIPDEHPTSGSGSPPRKNPPQEDDVNDSFRLLDPVRQAQAVKVLRAILPADAVLYEEEDTKPYECDGLSAYRQLPMVVALPENEEQVARILRACRELKLPVVARGAGTGLSGGALPHGKGVLLSLAKMKRILALDPVARTARVQPGVRNLAISEAAAPYGLY